MTLYRKTEIFIKREDLIKFIKLKGYDRYLSTSSTTSTLSTSSTSSTTSTLSTSSTSSTTSTNTTEHPFSALFHDWNNFEKKLSNYQRELDLGIINDIFIIPLDDFKGNLSNDLEMVKLKLGL